MYTHYWRTGAIPTLRVYRLSDMVISVSYLLSQCLADEKDVKDAKRVKYILTKVVD